MKRKYTKRATQKAVWNDEKILQLRKISQRGTINEAMDFFGYSMGQITYACQKFRVSFQKIGELHHTAKYSDELVEEVIAMSKKKRKGKKIPQKEIAEKTGVSLNHVRNIIYGYRRNE